MTVTLIEPEAQETSGGDSPEMSHWYCCNDLVALCGHTDNRAMDLVDNDDPSDCVVCQDLYEIGGPCSSPDCPYREPAE